MLALTSISFDFNTYFGIVKVSQQYFYSYLHFGDQWIFHEDFRKPSKYVTFTCTHSGLLSPTGVITALAVAVGLLAVALLFSIGVAIHRRRAHYSREV